MAKRKPKNDLPISSEVPQEEREGVERSGFTWCEPAEEGGAIPPDEPPPPLGGDAD
jgi:hypothetical protein